MKVLFFISVMGHGRGGHFHSLNHISNTLSENMDVNIYTIGPGKSSVLENNSSFKKHIPFNGINILQLRSFFNAIKRKNDFDVIHCFDSNSYNIVRLFLSTQKYFIFLNKCGGPNPIIYPHIPNLIVFSKENLEWFKERRDISKINLKLIPNRVKKIKFDKSIDQLIKKNEEHFTFVRICRIGKTYLKSIEDSIELISKLHKENLDQVRLIIIGTIEDVNIFEKLKNIPAVKNNLVRFLTNGVFTKEASKMLYLADAVIGTGRGLMEAASLSIPILAINKTGNIPVLLNEKTFEYGFRTNFSERNDFPENTISDNFSNIINLVKDKAEFIHYSSFAKNKFQEHFDIQAVNLKYHNSYKDALYGSRFLMKDFIIILRSLRSFYSNSKKKE